MTLPKTNSQTVYIFNYNYNSIKCEWVKYSKEKAEIIRLNKKQVQLYDVIRDTPQIKKYMSLKAKKWKKKHQVNNKCKWTGLAFLPSNKLDFKMKTITREKQNFIKGHFVGKI